ncbi:MAG TPA: dienelactone hydrolase family protein [Pseudonocardia sp.]|jgi:carboxymethylenebutenolidase|nr:dienelactone hydrolase family protein [Pseudonocardia sp.]
MALRDYLAGEVAEDFAEGLLSRREALRRLGLLGLGIGASGSLLAACAGPTGPPASATGAAPGPGTPSPAGPVPGRGPGTPTGTDVRFPGPNGATLRGAWAAPVGSPRGAVLVVHENRGLTQHFYDVVGRFAGAGYGALCVDLLSSQGGTSALTDPAAAPTALAKAPVEALVADLRAGIDELGRRAPGTKVGAVGFCFGGGMVWQLLAAGEARLTSAVPFYGPAPDRPDFSRAKAAVLALYGALDARVDATIPTAEAALRSAGLTYQVRVFPDANHAFFNDAGARYQPDAARAAWSATVDWLNSHTASA